MNNNIYFIEDKKIIFYIQSFSNLISFTLMTAQPVQTLKLKQPNYLNSLFK